MGVTWFQSGTRSSQFYNLTHPYELLSWILIGLREWEKEQKYRKFRCSFPAFETLFAMPILLRCFREAKECESTIDSIALMRFYVLTHEDGHSSLNALFRLIFVLLHSTTSSGILPDSEELTKKPSTLPLDPNNGGSLIRSCQWLCLRRQNHHFWERRSMLHYLRTSQSSLQCTSCIPWRRRSVTMMNEVCQWLRCGVFSLVIEFRCQQEDRSQHLNRHHRRKQSCRHFAGSLASVSCNDHHSEAVSSVPRCLDLIGVCGFHASFRTLSISRASLYLSSWTANVPSIPLQALERNYWVKLVC